VVKIVALVIGGLLVFGGFISCASSANSIGGFGEVAGIMIMLAGLLVGGIGYILGVLVQSAGQSMKAHFDCAVNGSHFLNDDQRAQAMSME
jgi:Zn-dependent protease